MKFLKFSLLMAMFALFLGCGEEEEKILAKPPVDNNIPKDVPIAESQPQMQINPDLPPAPVTE